MYTKKKLEDMNLVDNFLFGALVTYPEIGEAFTRKLLKIIFGREIGKLSVIPQKVYYGDNINLHGARLDVYLEEDLSDDTCCFNATIYDIEPEKNDKSASIAALPRRVRFYHAKIDSKSLESGADYNKLKNVIVIMIMPFDPFGRNKMVYTIKNCCVEVPDMNYDDGAATLFLYTKGMDAPSDELRQLLHYMEETGDATAVNEDLIDIQNMVETVKRDSEVSVGYMRMMEEYNLIMEEGREQGIEQGIEQGKMMKLVSLVICKIRKLKTPEIIAQELEEDVNYIKQICDIAGKYKPEYDLDKICDEMLH